PISSPACCLPLGQSWMRTTLSSQARAICLPSGEKLTQKTTLLGTGSTALRPCVSGCTADSCWAAATTTQINTATSASQARHSQEDFCCRIVMMMPLLRVEGIRHPDYERGKNNAQAKTGGT